MTREGIEHTTFHMEELDSANWATRMLNIMP